MLGLRLDEPVALEDVGAAVDPEALVRLTVLGLARADGEHLTLTRRGRFLGGGVTADLLAT